MTRRRRLLGHVTAPPRSAEQPFALDRGVVTAVSGSGVTVTLRGETLADLSRAGAAPSVADVVLLARWGRQYVVIGTITP